jgi:hypothetical protein
MKPDMHGKYFGTPGDVGITLRVTSIKLPLAAQPGAHEEYPSTKVGRYVGSKGGVLTSNAGRQTKKGKFRHRTSCNLVVPGQISRDLAHYIRAGRGSAEGHVVVSSRHMP